MLRNLNEVKNAVIQYSEQVLKMHKNLISSLKKENITSLKEVIHEDERINFEKERITDEIGWTIVKFQPISYDLRRAISYILIVKDLERIADIAKHVARTALFGLEKQQNVYSVHIKNILNLHNIFLKNFEKSLEIIKTEDISDGLLLIAQDKLINNEYYDQFINLVNQTLKVTKKEDNILMIRIIMTLKNIERAGDYLKNIIEEIIYIIKGQRIDN